LAEGMFLTLKDVGGERGDESAKREKGKKKDFGLFQRQKKKTSFLGIKGKRRNARSEGLKRRNDPLME